MNVKLVTLINSKEALQKLIEKELPVKTAFKLNKVVKLISPELENFEEQRVKLIKKYGTSDQDNNITVSPNNLDEFGAQLNDLLNMDVNINFEPISLSELGDVTISTKDLLNLEYLIKED